MSTFTVSPGQCLKALREARGLMPEDIPALMIAAGIGWRYVPTARTIRRAETTGHLPILRYRFGLAQFFGLPANQIWPLGRASALKVIE